MTIIKESFLLDLEGLLCFLYFMFWKFMTVEKQKWNATNIYLIFSAFLPFPHSKSAKNPPRFLQKISLKQIGFSWSWFVSSLGLWGKFDLIKPKNYSSNFCHSKSLKKRNLDSWLPYLFELNCPITGFSQGIMFISWNSMHSKRSRYVNLCWIFTASDCLKKRSEPLPWVFLYADPFLYGSIRL